MTRFRKGAPVSWTWGAHTARGKVSESFVRDVARTIKGERVKRKASATEPAYLIEQENGGCVLKSHSELERLS